MRAVVAVLAIVAVLVIPQSTDAFLLGNAGPASPLSPTGPTPSSPLFSPPRPATRFPLPPVLVAEVYYFALRDDEYMILENPGDLPVDLAGWRLSDREGAVEFPPNTTLPARERAVVARNATAYAEATGDAAEFTYGDGPAPRMTIVGGIPRLNNDGDEVLLLDPRGSVTDAFVYGGSPYSGAGWAGTPATKVGPGKRAVRASMDGIPLDTDTARDWDSSRSYGIGQSELPFVSFTVEGEATAFLAPDSALDTLVPVLIGSTTSVHASLYTLTNAAIGNALASAARRGVDVKVLLEGGPVGGIDEREWEMVGELSRAGAEVRFLADDPVNRSLARYRFLHAKYAVIDSRIVFVGSENWGEHGFPAPGRTGNRGWLVAVDDSDLAAYFEGLFSEDFDPSRLDSVPSDRMAPNLVASNDSASSLAYPFPIPPARVRGPFRVTPVVAPEHALRPDAVLGLLGSATETIDIEAFYVARSWGAEPNPYLEAAIEAARGGVRVRILLDDTWYNVEGDDLVDNDDTVAYVRGVARAEGLPIEAKIGTSGAHRLAKFHNKGVLVDGRVAFVSSLNWNRNAATNNREVGLVLEDPDLVAPFRQAFEHDWRDDVTSPVADGGPDLLAYVGAPAVVSAAGSLDDVGIVSFLWDVDGDGDPDAAGRVANLTFLRPGTYRVVLVVRDAWGNTDDDEVLVSVIERDVPIHGNPLALPLLALAAGNAALLWSFLRRKRGRKGLSEGSGMESPWTPPP